MSQYHCLQLSKFQKMLRFALQILTVDNLYEFKTQPTTKSPHKKHRSGTIVPSLASAALEFQEPL
jgi:hypothetical protein